MHGTHLRRWMTSVGICALAGVWVGVAPAGAEICAVDSVPAASLLLPYFEVDLDAADGKTTLMSIANARPEPTLAKVTLWTDLAVPTVSFDLYLTGFDVETLNLRDLFAYGRVPGDPPVPAGPLSLSNTSFEGCEFPGTTMIAGSLLLALQNAHLGKPSLLFGGQCAAASLGDRLARGFVTVDVVERCRVLLPGQEGYFGPEGIVGYDNVLWGDFFYVDPSENYAQGDSLVRLEASQERFGPGAHTFYGFLLGDSGADAREPLPFSWSTRSLNGGLFGGGTDLLVWRSPHQAMTAFDCQEFFGYPLPLLPTSEVWAFDEEENVELVYPIPGIIDPPPPPIDSEAFPFAANRRPLGDLFFTPSFDFGWLALDLRGRIDYAEPDPRSQAWVGAAYSAGGRFSIGLGGTALGSGCEPASSCTLGYPQAVGKLCLQGASSGLPPGPETLAVGGHASIVVYPAGCFSSSCTQVYSSGCTLEDRATSTWRVESSFCLAEDHAPGAVCTADCGGGGWAQCVATGLEAGSFSVVAGELSVTFTVPSTIPAGGLCDEL